MVIIVSIFGDCSVNDLRTFYQVRRKVKFVPTHACAPF